MRQAKKLMKEKKIDGYDAKIIFENTKGLEGEGGRQNEFNFSVMAYLEKIKYFG